VRLKNASEKLAFSISVVAIELLGYGEEEAYGCLLVNNFFVAFYREEFVVERF